MANAAVEDRPMMDVNVRSVTGAAFSLSLLKDSTSAELKEAIADRFQINPEDVDLTTVKGQSIDSSDGLAAVRSGSTVNVSPRARSGLDTRRSAGASMGQRVESREIFSLLESLQNASHEALGGAKLTIVLSDDKGSMIETELNAPEVAMLIRSRLSGALGGHGDGTSTDSAEESSSASTAMPWEMLVNAAKADADGAAAACDAEKTVQVKSGDKRKAEDARPDSATDAGAMSLAERRARQEDECRRKTKEKEQTKLENNRISRTMELLRQKQEAKKTKRERKRKQRTLEQQGLSPLAAAAALAAEVEKKVVRGFGGMKKGFLC